MISIGKRVVKHVIFHHLKHLQVICPDLWVNILKSVNDIILLLQRNTPAKREHKNSGCSISAEEKEKHNKYPYKRLP